MTLFSPVRTNPTNVLRKEYGLGKKEAWNSLLTIPFFGKGEQVVENMQIESGYYKKMFGNSLFGTATVSGVTIQDILYTWEYDKGDGTYQILVIVKTDTAKWKLRAITQNGTVVVPGGGVGDLEFTNGQFGYVQHGLFGYICCKSATNNLYSWDGTELTAVSNSIASPEFIFKNGGRIAVVAAGVAYFSSRVWGKITNFKVTATGVDMWGNYTVTNSGAMRGAIDANAGAIIFFEKGAELHNVYPNNNGDGILGETKTQGWNYGGRGPTNQQNITKSKNFVYITNEEGLIQIDPLSGQSVNLIINGGQIERLWKTIDYSGIAISYCPKQEMILIATRSDGEASNDFLICYHEPYKKFYTKTNVYAKSMGVINGDVYYGEQGGARIFKLFDKSTYEDGLGDTPIAKIRKEWDSFGAPEYEKRIQRVSAFLNINPASEAEIDIYKDNSTTAIKTFSVTSADLGSSDTSVKEWGDFISGVGGSETTTAENENVQKSLFFPGAFGTLSFEITENSTYDFRIYSFMVQYTVTGTSQGPKLYTNKTYSSGL